MEAAVRKLVGVGWREQLARHVDVSLRALALGDLSVVSARRISKEGRTPKAVAMLNRARTDGDDFPCSKRPI